MRSTIFATCLAASLCVTAGAVAQPSKPSASGPEGIARTDQARELYLKGVALYEQAQFEKAEAAFLAAWALKKHYQIASNLGACEMKLGRYRDAAEHLAFFLREQPPTASRDDRKRTQALFDEARAKVGAVVLTVSVPGAVVSVDGREIGAAPFPAEVYVAPGTRTFVASHGSYKDAQQVVQATAGGTQTVTLTLEALTGAAPQPPGGQIPPAPGGARMPVIITGAVLGGAGVILGAVFAGLSNARASDAAAKHDAILKMGPTAACGPMPSTDCQAFESAGRARVAFANASAWSFIAGSAVGAATVIYALAAPRAAKASGARVAPTLAAGGGGVVVQGEW
jgi:tetratricopeptide (TPR) repeat protein